MFFGTGTHDTRQLFFSSWEKYKQKKNLTPLEQQLINVMLEHPEYRQRLEQSTYDPQPDQENPFLHLGLHLAIRDQICLNKPVGITAIYKKLLRKHNDPHHIEHLMMEPLALCLWEAQRNNRVPDEISYLNACKELI